MRVRFSTLAGLVSLTLLACADGADTVSPELAGPDQPSFDETVAPPTDGRGTASQGWAEVVGCAPSSQCVVDGSTNFVAMLSSDPLILDAMASVRTPAHLSFGIARGPGTDTVPAGPIPGPTVKLLRQGAGEELTSYLEMRGFVVPTDTVPPAPFTAFAFDEAGNRVGGTMIFTVEGLIHVGVLTRSPQAASEVELIWTKGQFAGTSMIAWLPPTDTVPPGPGPTNRRGSK